MNTHESERCAICLYWSCSYWFEVLNMNDIPNSSTVYEHLKDEGQSLVFSLRDTCSKSDSEETDTCLLLFF